MKLTNKQIIIITGIMVSLPLFFIGVKGHDAVNHLIISRLFTEQFLAGDFYPRWLFKAEAGFGSPIMYHFPPLQYYIALVFYPLQHLDAAFGLPKGELALYATALLAIIFSGIFAFKYLNLIADEKTALLAAVFYMTAPYHLGIDLYYRFAFSELWALACLPLCLYYLQKNSLVGLAFAVAALILCHLLLAVIFLPVLLVYIIFIGKPRLLAALIIGTGLASFYWLPAVSNLNLISPQLGIGIYKIDMNFINLNTAEGIYLALAAFTTLVTGGMGLKPTNREKLFWFVVLVTSIFMALPVSRFIWHLLTPLAALSFPWRFLSLATLAATLLVIYLPPRFIIYLILLNLALAYPGIGAKNPEDPQKYLSANLLTIDDFRTKWTEQQIMTDEYGKSAKELNKLKYDEMQLEFLPREISIYSSRAGLITIPQFYFPNWRSEYELSPQAKTGLMQVNLRQPGNFSLYLARNREEKLGFAAALLSLSLLALSFIFIRRNYGKTAD